MKLTKEEIGQTGELLARMIHVARIWNHVTLDGMIDAQNRLDLLCEAAVEPDSLVGRRARVGKRTGSIKCAHETFSIDFGDTVDHVFREDCELIDEGEEP